MIRLENILRNNQQDFAQVIRFDPARQKLASLDLTANNQELEESVYNNTDSFSLYIDGLRKKYNVDYLVGGYDELRVVYGRSDLFSSDESPRRDNGHRATKLSPDGGSGEPRRLHIGTDIWSEVGTPVFAFMNGRIHSFAFNDNFGDYGATLILAHELNGIFFQTLYGHISVNDIRHLKIGDKVMRGQEIAHFGDKQENGHWPPHLHFQVIRDIEMYEGDYPGVCRYSERERYLANCPDPDLILQLNSFLGLGPSSD